MKVYSCGFNDFGNLGVGHTEIVFTPQEIIYPEGEEIIDATVYAYHTMFLSKTGNAYSCGRNAYGTLACGDMENKIVPTLVQMPNNEKLKKVVAGNIHSLFLTTSGKPFASGNSFYGSCGCKELDEEYQDISFSTSRSHLLKALTEKMSVLLPTPVCIDEEISDIATGRDHVLFLTKSGDVYGCGHGKSFRFGAKDEKNYGIPQRIMSGIQSVRGGGLHSLFLTECGAVLSVGYGGTGALGSGSVDDVKRPSQITLPRPVVQMAAGEGHSLFLTDDGNVYSCGYGELGALGHGDWEQQLSPKPIEFFPKHGIKVKMIAAGISHSVFLDEDGNVYTCGDGSQAQLGHSSWGNLNVPSRVEDMKCSRIAAGGYQTLFFI